MKNFFRWILNPPLTPYLPSWIRDRYMRAAFTSHTTVFENWLILSI